MNQGRLGVLLARTIHPVRPDAEAAREATREAVDVVALSRLHRVTGLLARAWERAGLLPDVDPAAKQALRAEILEKHHDRSLLDEDLRTAGKALKAAGIPFLALKGSALGPLVYPEPTLRPMTDVDLLVPLQEKVRALETLQSIGFRIPSAEVQAIWSEAYYNIPIISPESHRAGLEVHWSIAQSGRHRPDIEGMFARSRQIEVAGETVEVPSAVDLLLHQALHLSYHYFEPKLIWLHDIALLLIDPPPPAEVISRAREWGMVIPLALALAAVEKAFPGAVPPPFLEFVRTTRRAAWIVKRMGGRDPLALIEKWQHRRTQLVLGLLMLDSPAQILRTATGYISRRLRFGDRIGHKLSDKKPRPTEGP